MCLCGVIIVVFNRSIGDFAKKYDPFIEHSQLLSSLYFPRASAVVVGLLLVIGGVFRLIDEIN